MARPRKLYHSNDLDDLSQSIMNELSLYSEKVSQMILQIADKLGDEGIQMLEQTSPKDTGDYGGKWKKRIETLPGQPAKLVLYNKKYQLTHLLEFGHASVNGGTVPAEPHIAKVQDWINDEFEEQVKAVIEAYDG